MKRFLKVLGLSVLLAGGVLAVFSLTPWGGWIRNRLPLRVVRVDGRSMEPTFYQGDLLLFVRAPLRVGQVVLWGDEDGLIIKRVKAIHPATHPGGGRRDSLDMTADNPTVTEEFSCGADYCRGRFLAQVWRTHSATERQAWSPASAPP